MPNLIGLPGQAVSKVQQYLERGSAELHYVRKIFESGAFRIEPPLNYAAMAADIYKWGEFGMLPSMNARQLVVIVSASSKRSVIACMCDSFAGLISMASKWKQLDATWPR